MLCTFFPEKSGPTTQLCECSCATSSFKLHRSSSKRQVKGTRWFVLHATASHHPSIFPPDLVVKFEPTAKNCPRII
ncbi:hypothetical protein M413DRAFT_240322 [Hebeloma cylindrosporum]|uniref:Uncharacterized protein n=1 Tax=Hebeloma cylindrosporum TaxID=76867 RepID=A0A0C3C520_HEBCY|nr:hypothetical protein M413DRAFT_240322 [Hebeloma cylindrosporum h7]